MQKKICKNENFNFVYCVKQIFFEKTFLDKINFPFCSLRVIFKNSSIEKKKDYVIVMIFGLYLQERKSKVNEKIF